MQASVRYNQSHSTDDRLDIKDHTYTDAQTHTHEKKSDSKKDGENKKLTALMRGGQ